MPMTEHSYATNQVGAIYVGVGFSGAKKSIKCQRKGT